MDNFYKCIIACIICIIIICIIIIIDIEINIIDPNTITILCGIVITLGSGIVYSIYKKDKEENRDIYANIIPKSYSIEIEGNNEVNDIDHLKYLIQYYDTRINYSDGIYKLISEELEYKGSDKDISITDKLFNLFQSDDTLIKRIKLNNIFNLTNDALIITGHIRELNEKAHNTTSGNFGYYQIAAPKKLILYRHYENDELENKITQIHKKYPLKNIKYVDDNSINKEKLEEEYKFKLKLDNIFINNLADIYNLIQKKRYIGKENQIIQYIDKTVLKVDVTINDLINAYILKH